MHRQSQRMRRRWNFTRPGYIWVLPLVVMVTIVFSSCTSNVGLTPESPPTTSAPTSTPLSSPQPTVEPPSTSTQPAPTINISPEKKGHPLVGYAVVAWESAGKLVLFLQTEELPSCEATPPGTNCGSVIKIAEVDVPAGPHNLAAHGSVVLVTHPRIGQLSRYDVDSGQLISVDTGGEPHDVKFGMGGSVAYVTDESGRRLLTIDPSNLEILRSVDLPGEPHDLALGSGGEVWVTLVGLGELARVEDAAVEVVFTGRSPHDLIVAPGGQIWFSNWNSDELTIFDPETGVTEAAPAGVDQPHHFAIDQSGAIWVSDNGGSSVVAFGSDRNLGDAAEVAVTVEVGATPHHLAFLERDLLVVAVTGTGEVVAVSGGKIVGRVVLSPGLHGIAVGKASI